MELNNNIMLHHEQAQRAILDFFAIATDMPIGLYEIKDGKAIGIITERSRKNFEAHCRFIQSFPDGKARCENDQCNRALHAIKSQTEELTLCHAGLYNQAMPIKINGEIRSVLLYGEMLISDQECRDKSIQNHEATVQELGLDPENARELHKKLLSSKEYSLDELDGLKEVLIKLEQWLYLLVDEEYRLKRSMVKVSHEIYTRLQSVIAKSENLALDVEILDTDSIRDQANKILAASLAMNTVVQTLGDYLEEYKFESQPISELLIESRSLYETEAARRGINIKLDLSGNPLLEISKPHMQIAINNLLHNAVKYSFRSGPGRQRYVLVKGQSQNKYYSIVFENYGVGILPDEIAGGLIYQEDYQGKLTMGEFRTGSGKGLNFVKRIIEQHNGYMEVTSVLKAGPETHEGKPHLNRFIIYLPYIQTKENQS